ncbi:hypothetical protein H8K55_09415 [Undibacterium sp. LX15W]|uniref:DUF5723 domain-containing protein n=1 Tax=Undibacterium flavidum TaxID=2762297 RepID=A0ABR6YAZ1_9BURK|nr:hypothetical protein [Undibacterium flavidum]
MKINTKRTLNLLIGIAAICSGALHAQTNDDASSINYSIVFSNGLSKLNASEFPVSAANRFASQTHNLSMSADGDFAGISWRARALFSRDDVHTNGKEFRIKELNKVWTVSDRCVISAGKRILAWDVGYLAQPVGFFQTQTVLTDLVDTAGNSEGLPLAMFSCSVGKQHAVDVVYSDDFDESSMVNNRGLRQAALRLSGYRGQTSYAVIARQVKNGGYGFGTTVSTTIGDELELHGSLYAHHGSTQLLHRGLVDSAAQFWRADPYLPYAKNSFSTQALLGFTWTPRDFPIFTVEFSHNDNGLNRAQWQRWQELVTYHQKAHQTEIPKSFRDGNLLWDLKTINQQGTRRDYAYVQVQGTVADIGYSIGQKLGLNDRSIGSFVSLRKELNKTSYVMLALSHFSTAKHTEFAYLPSSEAVTLRIGSSF